MEFWKRKKIFKYKNSVKYKNIFMTVLDPNAR